MKLTLTLILVLTFLLPSFAQEEPEYQHRLAMHYGPSFPLGNFANKKLSNNKAGFAKTGYYFEFNYQRNVFREVHITANIIGIGNSFDSEALQTELNKEYPNANYSVSAGSNQFDGFFIGGKIERGDRLKWYINPILGGGTLISAERNLSYTNSSGNQTIEKINEGNSSFSFAYGLGFGIEYFISDRFSVVADSKTIKSNFEMEVILEDPILVGNTLMAYEYYDQPFMATSLSIGIVYRFDFDSDSLPDWWPRFDDLRN